MLEAFATGSVTTRNAYIALEHEWMHLETLAYMLAQEQRLSFENSPSPVSSNGQDKHSSVSVDSSSDDEMLHTRPSVNGQDRGLTNGVSSGVTNRVTTGVTHGTAHDVTNGVTNGFTNGHACGVGPASVHGKTNGNSHILTNGNNNSGTSNGHVSQSASMVQIPAGDIILGADTDPSKNFVWDNEGPRQSPQHVGSFQMASRPISNAEYYKFAVEAQGYKEEEYWKAEDLACLKKRTQSCPATWTVQVSMCLLLLNMST